MNRLPFSKQVSVITALVEGNSIRATSRMTGVAKGTILTLLEAVGTKCAIFHHNTVRGVKSRRIQCDEIWQFCYAKQKNVPLKKQGQFGYGDVWTWIAIDADTKLTVSYFVGTRDAGSAHRFMRDLAERLASRVQLTTDGHRAYLDAVEDVFGSDIDYATLVKLYGAPQDSIKPDTRYSPPVCIGAKAATISGRPDRRYVSTSCVERQNLTMRMQMRRFTRLTNGFSKKVDNLCHAVALYAVHYNFCRVHSTLRVTPAMESGLSDHVWTVEEIINLLAYRQSEAA
jgi:IS1 family transposase